MVSEYQFNDQEIKKRYVSFYGDDRIFTDGLIPGIRRLKVRLVSPANKELDEAVRYYDHQLPGLGFRFFQEVAAAIERIRFMPEAWTIIGDRSRRCILKGFPYAAKDPEHYKDRIR